MCGGERGDFGGESVKRECGRERESVWERERERECVGE